MPIFIDIDGVIYDGEKHDFEKIALAASVYVCLFLGLDSKLSGDPLIYYPVSHDPAVIAQFLQKYTEMFQLIREHFESFELEVGLN